MLISVPLRHTASSTYGLQLLFDSAALFRAACRQQLQVCLDGEKNAFCTQMMWLPLVVV